MSQLLPAVEILVEGSGAASVVVSCEHASNALPDGLEWGDDEWLREMHWAWDPGVDAVTRALARAFGARAVLSRFSRLAIDVNRPLESDTLFRSTCDGRSVGLNANLDDAERQRRIDGIWTPYHETLDAVCAGGPAELLLSIHSFTPVYEGSRREVEIGVLFNHSEEPATELMRALEPSGFVVRANEPWSGKQAMMYSCERHSLRHGWQGIELEFRQDLLADPATRERIIEHTARALTDVFGFRRSP